MAHRHFSVEDGLPSMTIYRILQAEDGRIWLGTDHGLSRFNGFQFKNYGPSDGLPGSEVIHMAMDDQDRVWVGTFSGKIAYLKNDRFIGHEQANWIPNLDGIPRTLAQAKNGDLVVGTKRYAWLFGPSRAPTILTGEGLYRQRFALENEEDPISIVSQNGIEYQPNPAKNSDTPIDSFPGLPANWSAFFYQNVGIVPRAKLYQLERDSSFVATAQEIVRRDCPDCLVVTMAYDNQRNLWLGTKNQGLYHVKRSSQVLGKPLEDGEIITLVCDQQGNMWVGTNGRGLYMFRESDLDAFLLNQSNGLLENHINFIAPNTPGSLLLGYLSGSISQLDIRDMSEAPLPPLPPQYKRKLKFWHRLNGNGTLLGFESGCFFLPDNRWQEGELRNLGPPTSEPSPDQSIRFITPISKIQASPYLFLNEGTIKDLSFVSDSLWYISTSTHLFQCKRNPLSIECTSCLSKRTEALIYEARQDRIWVSTIDSLLYLENGKVTGGLSLQVLGSRVPFLLSDPLAGIWIGTQDNGIFYLREGNLQQIDKNSGLPSNNCTAMRINSQGEVLVGTDKGLAVISIPNRTNPAPHFVYHDQRTGLADNYILDIHQTGDTIWMATRKGLSFWIPNSKANPNTSPVLTIESVSVNGKDTLVQESYQLSYWQNSFSMQFYDPSYQSDAYQFRCLGQDTTWYNLDAPTIQLPFLAPGHVYELQIRARSAFQDWGSPTTIRLDIREAFFKSTLFFFLLGAGLLGILGAIFAFRQRNQNRLAREREVFQQQISKLRLSALKARMNPHFIFNSLNAIQHLVAEGQDRNTFDFISSFSKLVRLILDNSDKDFISLGDEIELCQLYLKVESKRLYEDFQFTLHIDSELSVQGLYIPTMIVQPFLENAIWHGLMPKQGDRRLTLSFLSVEEGFKVVVEDNGIGREAARGIKASNKDSFPSQATTIFDQRISLLNQSFNETPFQSYYDDLADPEGKPSGTRLTLIFPNVHNPIQF